MSLTKAFSFPREYQETLNHLVDILHLFHHRSKNQHRHSIWWRHFCIFRRQLSFLTKDISQLHSTPTTHLARTRKKLQEPQLRARIQDHLSFWQDILVPRWHRAFSQATADLRFAVLGLVLLAALAEVCRITSVTAELELLGQAEVEKVLQKFACDEWKQESAGTGLSSDVVEDAGEVIRRDEEPMVSTNEVMGMQTPKANDVIADEEEEEGGAEFTIPPKGQSKLLPANVLSPEAAKITKRIPNATAKKKIRRKGGNAIDDLFAGF